MKLCDVTVNLAENLVKNQDLIELNDKLDQGKLSKSVGVDSRYWLKGQKLEDLIFECANSFMKKNQYLAGKTLVVISVNQSGGRRFPGYANQLQYLLGLAPDSICIDLNMGCSGFIYASYLMKCIFSQSENIDYGVILTADGYSNHIDKDSTSLLPVFGDACSLSLLNKSNGYTTFDFLSDGSNYDKLTMNSDQIEMNGQAVFQFVSFKVSKRLKAFIGVNEKMGIHTLYLHQASKVSIDNLIKILDLEDFRIPINLHKYGNCTSTSIPLLINDDIKSGLFDGKFIACGFGVGLSYGSMIMDGK
jgi:3-oxoacyl-[acyl-carrier-protein] synthase-3